jgi:DNA-binding NarL/FixJ family response regulator
MQQNRNSILGDSQSPMDAKNLDHSPMEKFEVAGKILVYGRQAFASLAFCEMLSKEFPDRSIVNANNQEALHELDPNFIDLVVVTTSAASNQTAMDSLSAILHSASVRPVLTIIGDVGFATNSEQATSLNLRGVFPDDADPSVVLAGLRFILLGGEYFPRDINELSTSEQALSNPASASARVSSMVEKVDLNSMMFTTKELAVLKCISTGMSNKAISRELGIAENTTKIHVRGILRKLSCSNRTEAALLAQRHNLLEA